MGGWGRVGGLSMDLWPHCESHPDSTLQFPEPQECQLSFTQLNNCVWPIDQPLPTTVEPLMSPRTSWRRGNLLWHRFRGQPGLGLGEGLTHWCLHAMANITVFRELKTCWPLYDTRDAARLMVWLKVKEQQALSPGHDICERFDED